MLIWQFLIRWSNTSYLENSNPMCKRLLPLNLSLTVLSALASSKSLISSTLYYWLRMASINGVYPVISCCKGLIKLCFSSSSFSSTSKSMNECFQWWSQLLSNNMNFSRSTLPRNAAAPITLDQTWFFSFGLKQTNPVSLMSHPKSISSLKHSMSPPHAARTM